MSSSSSFNSSLEPQTELCLASEVSVVLLSAMTLTNLLLLPVFILVLFLGYQQWRQRRRAPATAPSNVFTYHAVALQLLAFLAVVLVFYGSRSRLWSLTSVGICLLSVTSAGQALFHILTCVEHYLAVVHAVTYLRVKGAGEAGIRRVCAGCVWLLSSAWLLLIASSNPDFSFISYCVTVAVSLAVICFCSISVLCALRRPGPGEGGGTRAQADQSKQRAFYTILIILGVLLLGFVGNVIVRTLPSSPFNDCALFLSSMWLNFPSNLLLPVLFLHRAGKLRYCQQKITSCLDEAGAAV